MHVDSPPYRQAERAPIAPARGAREPTLARVLHESERPGLRRSAVWSARIVPVDELATRLRRITLEGAGRRPQSHRRCHGGRRALCRMRVVCCSPKSPTGTGLTRALSSGSRPCASAAQATIRAASCATWRDARRPRRLRDRPGGVRDRTPLIGEVASDSTGVPVAETPAYSTSWEGSGAGARARRPTRADHDRPRRRARHESATYTGPGAAT